MKGYKVRADGSKTSYFTREVDEQTKAMLDAQKAPKRLSVGSSPEAERQSSGSAGSAWNNGTTWEEKDMSEWAKGELESRLKAVQTGTVGGRPGGAIGKVGKVKDLEGSASVVASRGTTRYLYDYTFELEFKVSGGEAPADGGEGGGEEDAEKEASPTKAAAATVCRGTLSYKDVCSSKATGTV